MKAAPPAKEVTSPEEAVPPQRAYRGAAPEARRAERREKLIQAGIELFGTIGYQAASVKAICRQAGLTERYFYESFSNSEELLEQTYLDVTSRLFFRLAEVAEAEPEIPMQRAAVALETYYTAIEANRTAARLILFEVDGVSPRIDATYRTVLRATAGLIQNIIGKGLPDPSVQGLSAELLAMGMLGAAFQIAKEWALEDFKRPIPDLVRNVLAVFQGVFDQWAAASTPKLKGKK